MDTSRHPTLVLVCVLGLFFAVRCNKECDCVCSEGRTACELLQTLGNELSLAEKQIIYWKELDHKVEKLNRKVASDQEEIKWLGGQITKLKTMMQNNTPLPVPQPLVSNPENLLKDSDEDANRELTKNVTNLLAKVEAVQNMTLGVQEELENERRVRRHLQEDLNQTQTHMRFLDYKLENVTYQDMAKVEEIVFSRLDDLNRTVVEECLRKFEYKVDDAVYKNDTKQLDARLEKVENKVLADDNSTAIEEVALEMRNITEKLNLLNASIDERFTAEGSRLSALENDTTNEKYFEDLEKRMESLKNDSEAYWNDFNSLQVDVGSIQNETLIVNAMLSMVMNRTEIYDDFLAVESSSLEKLGQSVILLIEELNRTHFEIQNMQEGLQTLASDFSSTEHRIEEITRMKAKQQKLIESLQAQIDGLNQTMHSNSSNETEFLKDQPTESSNKSEGNKTKPSKNKNGKESKESAKENGEYIPCTFPNLQDSKLLIGSDNESGVDRLLFGCRPIGHFALNDTSEPFCKGGIWKGSFPNCISLLDEKDIAALSRKAEHSFENPCIKDNGQFPYPADCTKFYDCWEGVSTLMICPTGLHFDPSLQRCDYVDSAKCVPEDNDVAKALNDLIPPIRIYPNNLDRENGLMATGDLGELVVYPKTTFTLYCFFPEGYWGTPIWEYDSGAALVRREGFIERNKVGMTIQAATGNHSGNYICRTPFGKQHRIRVVVKDIRCPEFPESEIPDGVDVFYRMHPDAPPRILSTRAVFQCEQDGTTFTAQCLVSGSWSRSPPQPDECLSETTTITESTVESTSSTTESVVRSCPSIDTSLQPYLKEIPRTAPGEVVWFECTNSMELNGDVYIQCLEDGTWPPYELPICD